MPKDFSVEDFFFGCFGIIADNETDVERVKLKVNAGQANYIRSLKLHSSQEETERNPEYSIFIYYLRPTYDFLQEILWQGEDVEVLEPLWLRKDITEKLERMMKKYKKER